MIYIYNIIIKIKKNKIIFCKKIFELEIIIRKLSETEKSPTFSFICRIRGKDMEIEGELLRKL